MKKFKLIALMGMAGSGKDTLMQSILAKTNFNEIISCTTRPKREGEIDGKNYHFISKSEFFEKEANGLMLETTCFNNWYYGTSLDSLDETRYNIGVFNPDGVRAVLKNEDIHTVVFYITAKDKTRLLRQLNRENNPNVDEIIRRYSTDKADFSNLEFDYILMDNESLDDIDRNRQTIMASI